MRLTAEAAFVTIALVDAIVVGPGEGERFDLGGTSLEIKSTADSSGGAITLNESTLAPGFPGPPAHRDGHLTGLDQTDPPVLAPGEFVELL